MREVLIIKVELGTTLSNFTPLDLKIVPLLSPLAVNNLGLKQMYIWLRVSEQCLPEVGLSCPATSDFMLCANKTF